MAWLPRRNAHRDRCRTRSLARALEELPNEGMAFQRIDTTGYNEELGRPARGILRDRLGSPTVSHGHELRSSEPHLPHPSRLASSRQEGRGSSVLTVTGTGRSGGDRITTSHAAGRRQNRQRAGGASRRLAVVRASGAPTGAGRYFDSTECFWAEYPRFERAPSGVMGRTTTAAGVGVTMLRRSLSAPGRSQAERGRRCYGARLLRRVARTGPRAIRQLPRRRLL